MIVVTLLAILISLAYMVFDHLTQTYYRTEHKWIIERDIAQTMTRVSNAIDASLSLTLSNDIDKLRDNTGTLVVYYDTENKKVWCREASSDSTEKEPYIMNETDVELSFSNINSEGEERDNVVYIKLTSLDSEVDYTLETAVHMLNLDKITIPDGEAGPFVAMSFVASDGQSVNLGVSDTPTGCFIATATYGDYDDNMVMLLRRFRDQCLLTNPVGERFVEFYYKTSPPIADFIADSNLLKNIVKILLLPIIGVALFLLHPAPISAIMVLLIGLVILVKILLKKRKILTDI